MSVLKIYGRYVLHFHHTDNLVFFFASLICKQNMQKKVTKNYMRGAKLDSSTLPLNVQ